MSQPKVFEFAKEIGMETLALMDKIREWKLPVRSHMAELDPGTLDLIKARLQETSASDLSKAKKKVVKKATPKAAATKSTNSAPPASAGAKKATARPKATAVGAAPVAPVVEAAGAKKVVVKRAVAKVVVRRKADEEQDDALHGHEDESGHDQEQVQAQAQAQADVHVDAHGAGEHDQHEDIEHVSEHHEPVAVAKASVAAPAHVDEIPVAPAARLAEVAPKAEASVAAVAPSVASTATAHVAPANLAADSAVAATPSASNPSAGPAPLGEGAPVPARKREVVMTNQGPVSGVRSEPPRRNIVGRMDLSRVQNPGSGPTSRPGGPSPIGAPGVGNFSRPGAPGGFSRPGGPSSGPGGGPGGFSRPGGPSSGPGGPRPAGPGGFSRPGGPGMASGSRPGGLRTGFVSQAPVAPPTDDAGRHRFEERKRPPARGGSGPGTGAGAAGARGSDGKEEVIVNFSSTEFRKREMVFQPKKKKAFLGRESMRTQLTTPKASKRLVKVDQNMKLSDLANEMGLKAAQLTKSLMKQGVMATMNTELDFDTIALILPEFGFEAQNVHRTVEEMITEHSFNNEEEGVIPRSPVVTIMGHVDHGKTSLLDAIRKARVAAGEAGGITQHIGAYQVTTPSGHLVTFIDTPGHEAFTAMRARGANATDIAIIVVAADDGVMPQTIEAVSHAKAAGVPIIVAVNKMDKAGANPDRVKQQLTEQQLVPEEWGGDTIYVPVSAHTQEGLPQLLEQIHLVAEMAELKANPERSATGVVIESRMDKGRGPVATLLVQDGTLKIGQSIVVGSVVGRVRSLLDFKGTRIKEAGPSVPVEIQGLPEVPMAGDRFDVTVDEKAAAEIAGVRRAKSDAASSKGKLSLEDMFAKLKATDLKELPIVLKTDVAGSVEAIRGMFEKIQTSEVKVKIIHAAVGGISESDVLLASTAKGIVVGFNVRPDGGASAMAKREGTDIKTYSIVYELMDDMKKAMAGLLAPEIVEKQLGRAEVRETFTVPKIGTIAGSSVVDGKITRNAEVRLVRDGKIIYTGKLASLKRFKDDAKEVAQGYECGIGIENYNDVKVGDVIEAFQKESIVRAL